MEFPKTQQGWETLLSGHFNRKVIIEFLEENKEARNYFMEIILLQADYAWRAAWLLKSAINLNDNFDAFIERAIARLPSLKDGHQREILKLFEKLPLDEAYEGHLFDVCMGIWESPGKIPTVRMSAFLFILKTMKKYPELQAELDYLTQAHYLESLSPGVKRALEKRVRILKKL